MPQGVIPNGLCDGEGVVGVYPTYTSTKKNQKKKSFLIFPNNFFIYIFAYIRFFSYLCKIIDMIWSIYLPENTYVNTGFGTYKGSSSI